PEARQPKAPAAHPRAQPPFQRTAANGQARYGLRENRSCLRHTIRLASRTIAAAAEAPRFTAAAVPGTSLTIRARTRSTEIGRASTPPETRTWAVVVALSIDARQA